LRTSWSDWTPASPQCERPQDLPLKSILFWGSPLLTGFLHFLDSSTITRPYKVIDVPLKEKQKCTVKLVEVTPDKVSQAAGSEGEVSDTGRSDFRVVKKTDEKSASSVTSSNNIEEKMETLRLKKRRPSIESSPSQHSSLPKTDEFMNE